MRSINTSRAPRKDGTQPVQITVRVAGHPNSKSATYDTIQQCEAFAVEAERRLRLEAPEVRTRSSLLTQAELEAEPLKETFKLFLDRKNKYATERHRKHAPAILRNIGGVRRCGITMEWVEDYIEHMRAQTSYRGTPYAWETIGTQLHLINKVLKWRAAKQQLTHVRVPFDVKAMFPRGWQKRRTRRFQNGEEAALMQRLSTIQCRSAPHWSAFVQFALETGARLQELVGAKWEFVNWEQRDWFIPAGKTDERHVPLSLRAIDLLRQMQDLRHPESDRIFHELGDPGSVSNGFRGYSREAGLVDFRAHDLRHEAISRLVIHKRKLSLRQIGLMVGHSEAEMTEYYAHLRAGEIAALLDD